MLGITLLGIFAVLVVLGKTPTGDTWPVRLLASEPTGPRVGLIAGHWQSDAGTVCADGLQEADVNLAVAKAVAARLRAEGFRAEVLAEFDDALDGYQAAALVSIHADSCQSSLSGFKVARSANSAIPETEDRLVALLYEHYQAETGLLPHTNTITDDMRDYHAFRQIAPETPAAIIECGFLGGDRAMLTEHQDRVARGIATAVVSFLAP